MTGLGFDPDEEERIHDAELAVGRGQSSAKKQSMSSELVDVASILFTIGVSTSGDPFAVAKNGPRVALMLRGGRDSLRARLAATYASETGRVPSSSALADAVLVLEGRAALGTPEPVHLRLARDHDRLVVDLGRPDGRVVLVGPDGWYVSDRSPVLFRRTELTGELPVPAPGGDLEAVRTETNISADSWPLVRAALVAALDPDIPHPVLAFFGEQGVGKSSAIRKLGALVDPSPAPLRSMPRDLEQWAVTASGSYLVPIDNVSAIASWLSDALCRAVTGDGLVRRRLYTDSDVTVLSFKRMVMLSSIDVGALRGDLGDRLVVVDMDRIPPTRRRTDEDIATTWASIYPAAFSGLLDLTVQVLATLPSVQLPVLPRMADFGRILGAIDQLTGETGISTYFSAGTKVAEDVIDSEPVAVAIHGFIIEQGTWEGIAGELLDLVNKRVDDSERRARTWPKSPKGMGGVLRRIAPALRTLAVSVEFHRHHDGRRLITLTHEQDRSRDVPSRPSRPSREAVLDGSRSSEKPRRDGSDDRDRHSQLQSAPALVRESGEDGAGFAARRAAAIRGNGHVPELFSEHVHEVGADHMDDVCVECHTRPASLTGGSGRRWCQACWDEALARSKP